MHQEDLPDPSAIEEVNQQIIRLLSCLSIEARCELRAQMIQQVMASFDDDMDWMSPITDLGGVRPSDLGDCDASQDRLAQWAWEEAIGDPLEYICSPATPAEDLDTAANAARNFARACQSSFGASVDQRPDQVLRELRFMRAALIQRLEDRVRGRPSSR